MKKLTLQEFLSLMNSPKGALVLRDAVWANKVYAKKKNLDIRMFQAPTKFIKVKGKIYVITLTQEIWGGITVYKEEDLCFSEKNNNLIFTSYPNRAKDIINILDYQSKNGYGHLNTERFTFKYTKYRLQLKKYKTDLLKTPYLSEFEYHYYSNKENYSRLTLFSPDIIIEDDFR